MTFISVWVTVDGEIVGVTSLGDAALFLADWPDDRRDDAFFDAAHAVTLATTSGSVSIREARTAFRAFCASAGILAEADIVEE